MIQYSLSFEAGGIEVTKLTIVDSQDMKGNYRPAVKEEKICLFRIIKLKKTKDPS